MVVTGNINGTNVGKVQYENSKPISTPLVGHFKLSKRLCPSTKKEKGEMSITPYSSAVGSLTYTMVCTRPVYLM